MKKPLPLPVIHSQQSLSLPAVTITNWLFYTSTVMKVNIASQIGSQSRKQHVKLNQCLSRDLLTSDAAVKREKEEEKVSQNVSFLVSVKALTDMLDCISSCSLNTIGKSEHCVSKKHNLQLLL